ncbi:hypothetical protein LZP69_10540 [Shewanella sp. AS1]|uniref:hypothetical protein n=1 Tax=Shewanella sp. AS1 TaxID=2907626 RepID=UPI001F34F37B|nr:hypothetical protein [Shewanella sp. AS1]MCE9679597.1 hypothetical protein [Shewanella sp. AS1]
MEQIIKQRQAILMLLYRARQNEQQHLKGFVSENDLNDSLGECRFNLDVLVELGQVQRDGYKYRITGQGVVATEAVSL